MARIAVFGCGSIGYRHLSNLHGMGYEDLIACDPDADARARVTNTLGIACFSEAREIWRREPEVTLIASPSNQHVSIALQAVNRNSHVFLEKPVSHSFEGLDTLCREVRARRLVGMVGCNMRFHPGPAEIKRLLDIKRIGRVLSARIKTGSYLPRWRPWQDYRQSYSASPEWGGAVLDCVHEIDLAKWFFGGASVLGAALVSARAIQLETDGLAEILLHHESGVLCNVHVNFLQHNYRKSCEIVGTKGTIHWDFSSKTVTVFGADGQVMEMFSEPQGWQLNQMYIDEMKHFLSAIRKCESTMNPLPEALKSLEICLKVRETGTRVDTMEA